MAKNSKVIKTRITSVKNTKKITRSMQMIAAAKMQKTVRQVLRSKSYSNLAQELLTELGKLDMVEHELLTVRPVKTELLVLLSASRGLCGSFNANVLHKARDFYTNWEAEFSSNSEVELEDGTKAQKQLKVLAVGRKAAGFAKKRNLELVALYEKLSDNPAFNAVLPIAQTILTGYVAGEFDKVTLIYTNYQSSLLQIVRQITLLPLDPTMLLGENVQAEIKETDVEIEVSYKLEPDNSQLLNYILPRLVETQVYQSVLESAASEHSSRMIAMKSATDNASDLIKALNMEYNKSRQSSITQEVAEIIAGIEALS